MSNLLPYSNRNITIIDNYNKKYEGRVLSVDQNNIFL